MGMVTVRSGSALRVTVTDCVPPSATVYESWENCTVTSGATRSAMRSTSLPPTSRPVPKVCHGSSSGRTGISSWGLSGSSR